MKFPMTILHAELRNFKKEEEIKKKYFLDGVILKGFLEKVTLKLSLKDEQSNDGEISRQGPLKTFTMRKV